MGSPSRSSGAPPETPPRELADHLEHYCRDNRINVEVRDLPDGLAGYYQRHSDRIVLNASGSPGKRVATLAHELAHREDPELVKAHTDGDRHYYTHSRADCEAVAEGAAHVVSARFGHDITSHSAGYITGWIQGDIERFKQLHDRVGRVARALVPPDRLDALLTAARSQASLETPERAVASRRR